MKRIVASVLMGVALAAGVAGCGERDQSVRYQNGKFRGKPDSRPWDNAPPSYGAAAWAKGDRESWEDQVRSRQQTQSENHRIGH
jgi:hypothetical protein